MYFHLSWTHLSINYTFRDKSDYLPIHITERVQRQKIKKILYEKYIPMLTIRDDQIDNHFNDKFAPLEAILLTVTNES